MTRLERSLYRKSKRRKISLSLISIIIILLLALVVINNTMVQSTSISTNTNLNTIQTIRVYGADKVDYIIEKVQNIDIRVLRQKGQEIIEQATELMELLRERWNEL